MQKKSLTQNAVRLDLFEWDQVVALCDLRIGGPVRVDVTPDGHVDFQEHVTVQLGMPDGFTMSLAGYVVALKPSAIGGPIVPVVELTELTAGRARALRALAAPAHDVVRGIAMIPAPAPAPRHHPAPASLAASKVSELIRGNLRLRQQIDSLANHMLPSDDD